MSKTQKVKASHAGIIKPVVNSFLKIGNKASTIGWGWISALIGSWQNAETLSALSQTCQKRDFWGDCCLQNTVTGDWATALVSHSGVIWIIRRHFYMDHRRHVNKPEKHHRKKTTDLDQRARNPTENKVCHYLPVPHVHYKLVLLSLWGPSYTYWP